MTGHGPLMETVDHVVAISRGGADTPDNLCLACLECNLSKHAETAEEFLRRKDRPGGRQMPPTERESSYREGGAADLLHFPFPPAASIEACPPE
jgi:hypothetical protein